ncbi:hypothetical protein TrRE_jg3327 [Triparma retinervis]|uniref:t-SNARE coiled-coil homology domain-containing protein n=1 Tax=Triparma retinervis TaxID=2557542 RepID=A0A9W7AQS3_9STRA|nr:hypothetical protein TrRE_jg3327 [Triparma retinervis]
MESQNNERIGALSDQVAALKSLTLDINSEVTEQNRLLNDMDSGFGNIGGLLGSTMNRITTMMDATGSRHMWYLAGFVILVMVFLYTIMKWKYSPPPPPPPP